MVIAHILFIATATHYLNWALSEEERGLFSWYSVLGSECWVVAMAIMNMLTLLWEMWLLTEQFDAIAMGNTSYFRQCETPSRQQSFGQRWCTVLAFLLEGRRRMSGVGGQDKISIDI